MWEQFDKAVEQRGNKKTNSANQQHKDISIGKNIAQRQKIKLVTLNVYSLGNKLLAIEQYLKTNHIHVAVITETHLQEGEYKETSIKDYQLASSCSRRKGEKKGGVAIFVHTAIPFAEVEHKTATDKGELEFCSITVFPNHNEKERLQVTGVYRPPDTHHPPTKVRCDKCCRQTEERIEQRYCWGTSISTIGIQRKRQPSRTG